MKKSCLLSDAITLSPECEAADDCGFTQSDFIMGPNTNEPPQLKTASVNSGGNWANQLSFVGLKVGGGYRFQTKQRVEFKWNEGCTEV